MAIGGRSQYLDNALLNWFKGTTYPAAPTNVYLALFTTNPTDDSGTGAVEVSGGSYARQAIAASGGWSAISGGLTTAAQISNASTITFPTPTANWGTVIGIALYDSLTTGNLLYWTSISSQVVSSGVVVSFAASSLILTDD